MMGKNVTVAALCCALVLALGLSGCGGGSQPAASGAASPSASSQADPLEESKAAFTGSWDLVGLEENGEVTSQDDLDMLKERGLEVFLNLEENGSAALVLFGEAMNGSWEPKSAAEATFTVDGSSIPLSLSGGLLAMEDGGSKLTFAKGETRETPVAEEGDSSSSAEQSALLNAIEADEEESKTEIEPVTIADDGNVTIEVVAMGTNAIDDPCYYLNVTNKLDRPVKTSCVAGTFCVGGVTAYPYSGTKVEAGATGGDAVSFDAAEIGGGTEKLAGVEGMYEVTDAETGEKIAEYPFKM